MSLIIIQPGSSAVRPSTAISPNPDGGGPLTAADKHALVAFLKTLADEQHLSGKLAGAEKIIGVFVPLNPRLRLLTVN